ncbi:hypothetical protein J6590_099402 [Homalodisca vitripennis]|nr:hypothetical protein J6590_099402 [Homalodisca vitripennis]
MADMHLMYGLAHCNSRQARRLYQEHFPHRQLPTHKMFSSIHRRLSETGTFKSGKVGRSGRLRTTCTAELEEGVLDKIENHPGRSTRELALDFGVSNSIVWKILHEQQLHSYHYQRVQALCLEITFLVFSYANGLSKGAVRLTRRSRQLMLRWRLLNIKLVVLLSTAVKLIDDSCSECISNEIWCSTSW